jgi:hypothetical protein
MVPQSSSLPTDLQLSLMDSLRFQIYVVVSRSVVAGNVQTKMGLGDERRGFCKGDMQSVDEFYFDKHGESLIPMLLFMRRTMPDVKHSRLRVDQPFASGLSVQHRIFANLHD